MQLLGGGLCLLTLLTYSLFMAIYTNGINIERVYGDADVIKAVSGGEYIIDDTIEGNLRWRTATTIKKTEIAEILYAIFHKIGNS